MSERSLYEEIIGALPERSVGSRLRASAAVVPWRVDGGDLEVFWVERSRALPFMGGFFAFPGGGRAKTDLELDVVGLPSGTGSGPVDGALPSAVVSGLELEPVLAPGVAVAAVRELFEETGLLLTVEGGCGRVSREDRQRLLRKEQTFADMVERTGVRLDASSLLYAGRWITPPLGQIRFDNRFFLLEWPSARPEQPEVCGAELATGEWIRPAEAIDRWRRGEVMTAPPILHILEVLAEDGPEAGLDRLRDPRERNLGPHRWIEFRPGVMLFPLAAPTLPPAAYTNTYVLGTSETVVVDPGSPYDGEIEGLVRALEELARRGRRVHAVWLTHHHPDHVGGVEVLRKAFEVPVCAHPSTAERLAERGIGVDEHLEDGQRVVLDGDPPFPVRIVHAPGHARGHLVFLDESFGSLLGGDLTAGVGTIVIDPPEGDMDDYLESLRKVSSLNAQALFPAHGPPTLSVQEKLEEYIEHRNWRESRILDAWSEGLRGEALLQGVYDDVPAIALPLARRQLLAHLQRLRRSGRLPSEDAPEVG